MGGFLNLFGGGDTSSSSSTTNLNNQVGAQSGDVSGSVVTAGANSTDTITTTDRGAIMAAEQIITNSQNLESQAITTEAGTAAAAIGAAKEVLQNKTQSDITTFFKGLTIPFAIGVVALIAIVGLFFRRKA